MDSTQQPFQQYQHYLQQSQLPQNATDAHYHSQSSAHDSYPNYQQPPPYQTQYQHPQTASTNPMSESMLSGHNLNPHVDFTRMIQQPEILHGIMNMFRMFQHMVSSPHSHPPPQLQQSQQEPPQSQVPSTMDHQTMYPNTSMTQPQQQEPFIPTDDDVRLKIQSNSPPPPRQKRPRSQSPQERRYVKSRRRSNSPSRRHSISSPSSSSSSNTRSSSYSYHSHVRSRHTTDNSLYEERHDYQTTHVVDRHDYRSTRTHKDNEKNIEECSDFRHNHCNRGDSCRFNHAISSKDQHLLKQQTTTRFAKKISLSRKNNKPFRVILLQVPNHVTHSDVYYCLENIGIGKESIIDVVLRPSSITSITRHIFIETRTENIGCQIIDASQKQHIRFTRTKETQDDFVKIEARWANERKKSRSISPRSDSRKNRSNIGARICPYHYQSSGCMFGKDCDFDHPTVYERDRDIMVRVCPFFITRGCSFGSKCNLEHVCWRRRQDKSWYIEKC